MLSSQSSFSASMLTERIFEMCTPRLRWMPEHGRQTKTPRLIEIQRGPVARTPHRGRHTDGEARNAARAGVSRARNRRGSNSRARVGGAAAHGAGAPRRGQSAQTRFSGRAASISIRCRFRAASSPTAL
jgi:hypothetical protein